ncbi:helix-turn-helix domain-containing protein [Nonomuraea sp. CA-141351]|uniref:helix-turn-helix domain-containing protein n=1 Tax=Nonomuraea sp. CA-141351 TaxID=3239996 RepID=UPI003D8D5F0E
MHRHLHAIRPPAAPHVRRVEGPASARERGRVGGRPPALDAHGVDMARVLYEMKGDDGRRRHTVQQIADQLGVSRATVYRHLDPDKPVLA